MSEIAKFVDETEEFVIHDPKTGKPTNRKKTEKKGRIVFEGDIPDIKIEWVREKWGADHWSGLYRDDLEERFEELDVEYPSNCELLNGVIIGYKILDGGFCSSWSDTNIATLEEAAVEVKQKFAELGFNVEPGVYLIHYYS